MKVRVIANLSLTLGLSVGALFAHADDLDWRPTSAPPAVARARAESPRLQPPTIRLGAPVPVIPTDTAAAADAAPLTDKPSPVTLGRPIIPASYSVESPVVARAQAPDAVPPPPPIGGAVPPPPIGVAPGTDPYNNGAVAPNPGGNWFMEGWGQVKDSTHRRAGQCLESDHAGEFDHFASPVSSPFLTEDPRSLTEVKPLFIYQHIPGKNDAFQGGNIEFYGLQARIALTERWSIVMNKLGGIAIQPDDKTFEDSTNGFAELWIGPKYTFYRDDCNNTVAAAGVTFQIPIGSSKVFQDTGNLSISPYVSFAKSFGKLPSGYGNFNYMSTTGFAISTDNQRSDYFYSNLHLDFDVAGQHKLYPLIELNWTRYFNNANNVPLTFEGGDLFNFGSSQLTNKNLLTLATGARYKFSECVQVGAAVEFPLNNEQISDFRVTLDVIFRY
jgi:hypothetical protein